MASNLRVDSIVPATGANVSIGTATGGVNIPGVLTYEDVTNVDSIGVITARTGIKIGPSAGVAATIFADGSINTSGIVTATSFSGNGANLTGIDPSTSASSSGFLKVLNASTPQIRLNNDASDGATTRAFFGIATGNNNYINGSVANDTVLSARSGGDLLIGCGSTVRMKIDELGRVTNPARPCFDVAKDNGAVSSTSAIVFNVVNVNNGSHYDTSNGRFTAPVTGTYFLYYGGIKNNTNSVVRMKLLKNGTGNYMNADRELRMDDGDAYGENASMNVIVSLTATDYVQVYITEGTIYGTDASYTHFGGYLLS